MLNVTFDGHAHCRTMYKLLRSTCLHCFQLKMRQTEVDKFTEKLQLLAKGKLIEAAAVITGGGKAAETAKSFVEAGDEENANGNMLKGKGTHKANGRAAPLDGALMLHQQLPRIQSCCLTLFARNAIMSGSVSLM